MASSSRKTGESSTAVPITSISESESFYGFEFGTYAYNEIVRSIESSDINANKFVRQIFTACKNDPNPCSVTLGSKHPFELQAFIRATDVPKRGVSEEAALHKILVANKAEKDTLFGVN
ncbi:hypothetical protein HPULCUR_000107 [Helicostylum pulchrum]|uniref:Uncharacterized protein n=1 Tax=Helicostylum pulchrum TaxID=562976 RepID=A0ABP9XIX9_9FUNG